MPKKKLMTCPHCQKEFDPEDFLSERTKELREQAKELIEFLNAKTGKNFTPVEVHVSMIAARLREGASMLDCRQIVLRKVREWSNDKSMNMFLRPGTLFNREKFWQYHGELVQEQANESQLSRVR